MHAKFGVNRCCSWDFRLGLNLPPHAQTLHRHPTHNSVKNKVKCTEFKIGIYVIAILIDIDKKCSICLNNICLTWLLFLNITIINSFSRKIVNI